jgi:hypothetical protein
MEIGILIANERKYDEAIVLGLSEESQDEPLSATETDAIPLRVLAFEGSWPWPHCRSKSSARWRRKYCNPITRPCAKTACRTMASSNAKTTTTCHWSGCWGRMIAVFAIVDFSGETEGLVDALTSRTEAIMANHNIGELLS